MMKTKKTLFLTTLLCVVFNLYAEKPKIQNWDDPFHDDMYYYYEMEISRIKDFLRQPSAIEGKYNFEVCGLTPSDTLQYWKGWSNPNDDWRWLYQCGFENTHYTEDHYSFSATITSINLNHEGLAGTLDASGFNTLRSFTINYESNSNIKNVSLDNCSALERLSVSAPNLENITLGYYPALKEIWIANSKIKKLWVYSPKLSKVTLRSNNELEDLDLYGSTALETMEVTFCKKLKKITLPSQANLLKEINIHTTSLTQLNVSGAVNLNRLSCPSNNLTYLNVRNNKKLGYLDCANNKLTSLDISQNTYLNTFNCRYNQLTTLDLRNMTPAGYNNKMSVDCSYNNIKEILIDSTNTANWDIFSNAHNRLKLSTLPELNINSRYHLYSPQQTIIGNDIEVNDIIDLSSEYNIRGNITQYKWLDSKGNEINLPSEGNGIFRANHLYSNDTLTCQMTNIHFPGSKWGSINFIAGPYTPLVIEYKVYVKAGNMLTDHLKISTGTLNTHSVSTNRSFRVYAKTANPEELKIGLFSTNGHFISRIDNSYSNYVYTCTITDYVNGGSYMIQPYFETNGSKVIAERPTSSLLIDKLPVTVESDIWTFSASSTIFKNMQIKTSANNLYEVATDELFQVYAPSDDANTQIGLFDLYGNFVSRIDILKNNYTYKCEVPFDVYEGNYVVIPYTQSGNEINIVERNAGNMIIDRLPLAVTEGDIWLRSKAVLIEADTNTSMEVYPNPVQDILHIGGGDNADSIEIYDSNGRLVKKTENVSEIAVHELLSGVYIVKVNKNGQISSHKITKK